MPPGKAECSDVPGRTGWGAHGGKIPSGVKSGAAGRGWEANSDRGRGHHAAPSMDTPTRLSRTPAIRPAESICIASS